MRWTPQERKIYSINRRTVRRLIDAGEQRAVDLRLARRVLAAIISARSGKPFHEVLRALRLTAIGDSWVAEGRRLRDMYDTAVELLRTGELPDGIEIIS